LLPTVFAAKNQFVVSNEILNDAGLTGAWTRRWTQPPNLAAPERASASSASYAGC